MLLGLLLVPVTLVLGQEFKPVTLPAPQTSGGKPLMDVLKMRQSIRSYDSRRLSNQVLSNLLWAAFGVNRPDGKRTAASASNRQEIAIYVVMADGSYAWDGVKNILNPVSSGDLRAATGSQAWVAEAPVNLVYVADMSKYNQEENSAIATSNADAGLISQNVYLFCASEGLGTVVRGSGNREAMAKALKLGPRQRVILAQTIGYPKQ
jgi:SagB-type dehydrogenase family enzyme